MIDHIGYVVSDISVAMGRFVDLYGFSLRSDVVYDPAQAVNLVLLFSQNGYDVELIQPIDQHSPSYDFMQKGGGLHHFCYAVEELDQTLARLKGNGHMLIRRPVPAVLMEGRRVAFLFSKVDKQVIELVERTRA